MKILLIQDLISDMNGASKAVFEIKKLLEGKGHEVRLIGYKGKKETILTFFSRWYSFKYYYLTKKLIKNFKPDIVHIHDYKYYISISPIIAAKKLNQKIILTPHDFSLYCPKLWGIYKDGEVCKYGFSSRCFIYNCKARKEGYLYFPYQWIRLFKTYFHKQIIKYNVQTMTCASTTLTKYIKKTFPNKDIIQVPNFEDFQLIKKYKVNRKYFTYIGRVEKEKGIEMLIKSFFLVVKVKPEEKLQIIGSGTYLNYLKKLSLKLNLKKNIIFRGYIENNKLDKYYQMSKAVIIPSIILENITLVGIEAIKNKTFIIASNIGGIPDLIKNNNGILFEPNNINQLAKIMLDEKKFKNNYDNIKDYKMYSKEYKYARLMEVYNQKINE